LPSNRGAAIGLVSDTEGRFYLGKLLGRWRYEYQDKEAIGADIVNFREVCLVELGVGDAVPGKITACVPLETFQAIPAPGMLVRSAQLAGSPAGLGNHVRSR
jgi:hypothetical protein